MGDSDGGRGVKANGHVGVGIYRFPWLAKVEERDTTILRFFFFF